MLGSNQQDFPVVDKEENLTGIISMTDLRQAMADKEVHSLLLAKDIAMEGVTTVTMDDTLNTALRLMAELDVRELPVVSKDDPRKVISHREQKGHYPGVPQRRWSIQEGHRPMDHNNISVSFADFVMGRLWR